MPATYKDIFSPIGRALERYNDPELVVKFQRAFGVKSLHSSGDKKERSCDFGWKIENKFWYYLFCLGAFLGDDRFYISFYPFWIWNIDGAVGRQLCITWSIAMYFGQALKDIVCWPRPACPPVARLEQKYASEQGMPSTHAMIGFLIPVSAVIFTARRYEYPVEVGVVIAFFYCLIVVGSRLYLGMHSVSDVIVGLLIGIASTLLLTSFMDSLDAFLVTDPWSPFAILATSVILLYFYPKSPTWSRTHGDTAVTTAAGAGICFGAWMSYRYHFISSTQDFFLATRPPYPVLWPTMEMCGLSVLRLVIGLVLLLSSKAICRKVSKPVSQYFFGNADSPLSLGMDEDARRRVIEVVGSYLAYGVVAFNVTFTCQAVFTNLGIVRPLWYTEL